MLDLEFDQEQELLRQTARDLLASQCSLDVVRQMEDDPVGYPPALWEQLGQLDLIGLLLPEEYGGSGMTLLEGVALYEELGRALAPTPHFVSAVLSGGVLAAAGSAEQKEQWLRPVATGAAILTPAWLEPESGFTPAGVAARAVAGGDGFSLSGVKRHVAFAAAADRLVVLARTGDAEDAVDLFLVDPTAPGVTLRQQFSLASDTQYEVTFDGVALGADDRIGSAGSGWTTWQEVLEPALVLLGALAVGGARYALEITTQYAKDRHQFDKPLGAFQALAHYLADAVTRLDGAEQLVHEAAWAGATGRPLSSLAPMAKL
ncbi:MAG TPA: acyl-CoA dehydrogenase family protein, partial [Acidimicrobiales bacterium]|nr:acyl-CoA dehydrogenase family protein [Acidimicrobiales bacterium]